MTEHKLTQARLEAFRQHLLEEERSKNTVAKYLRDIRSFFAFLPANKKVTKAAVVAYKGWLAERYQVSSANSMMAAVNGLMAFLGWQECRVKTFKTQRRVFRDAHREMTKEEYQRLLQAAQEQGNERLYLVMQVICATGIRVSEHRFITVESIKAGRAQVRSKGKNRLVFLPTELKRPLLDYCRRHSITTGPVFVTRGGIPLDRSNLWAAMKALCVLAEVDGRKVFPHNLRHLFALTFYRLRRDVVRLADILGHSNVETTRIYTATTEQEQRRQLSRLGLVDSAERTKKYHITNIMWYTTE